MQKMQTPRDSFDPLPYERELLPILRAVLAVESLDKKELDRILKQHPKDGKGFFSRSELIAGYRFFKVREGWELEAEFLDKIRLRPVRTQSGVTPVTVLTKPFPCPGECIFCPSDVRMPKSYLASEPGAQRAAENRFDPYLQTYNRLRAFHQMGHPTGKVELIVLGGTWSFYPEPYQIWFVQRCFEAMGDFGAGRDRRETVRTMPLDFRELEQTLDGRALGESYNQVVKRVLKSKQEGALLNAWEDSSWDSLFQVQQQNESAACRCVGLVLETRPDCLDQAEVTRLRRLGATKIQVGIQSLSDVVLSKVKRGHDVATTRRAFLHLRRAGFKVHGHWMPNLYGSSVEADIEDYRKLFEDPGFCPDELKIYPCSLIESAELMQVYERGDWAPYDSDELLRLMSECVLATPEYCRLTRIVRDIPSDDIVAGNMQTNFREVVESHLEARSLRSRDIRRREIRKGSFEVESLVLKPIQYDLEGSREIFLQFVTPEDRIVGFLRLSLPTQASFISEIENSALIREVHVYGASLDLGERGEKKAQHLGLGTQLIEEACRLAREAGLGSLAVISAVGTREYYRRLAFRDGELYQHRDL